MPRTASTTKDIANRFLTKAVALVKMQQDVNEDIALLQECADRPESRTYKTAARSVQMTTDLIKSEINSLLGMHEKLISADVETFKEFVASVALTHFIDAADAPNAIAFAKAYGVSLDGEEK